MEPCASLEHLWFVTLLQRIEYLQYEGTKFSKSRGVGVFGNDAADTGIPVEVWRYYLLNNRPESGDSQFTWSSFIAANNNELLANLGILVVSKTKRQPSESSGKVRKLKVRRHHSQSISRFYYLCRRKVHWGCECSIEGVLSLHGGHKGVCVPSARYGYI